MSSWFDILILVILIGMNGAFALSEVALITSRRARLQHMDEESVPGARRAMDMNADPNRALSTIQVGITSIGLLSGIFGESALAKPVAEWLVSLGMGEETASAVGITLVVVLLTYFSIVMGELVPKRIGQMAPERLACRVSPVLHMLSLAAAPFVKLLSLSTASILRLMRVDTRSQNAVTEEEIHAMIDEGEESGVIETVERDMVRNVFRLDDRQVASLMTPRADIDWIDLEDSPRDVLEAIAGEFKPEQPGDAWVTRREDGSLLLDGMIPIPELKDVLDIKSVPEEDFGRYNTLAGMMMLLLGRLPKEGDVAEWDGWRLEIIDMDRRRIDKVLAVKVKTAPKQEGRGE